MNNINLIDALYESVGDTCSTDPNVAHIEIHGNEVLGLHLVPGLEVSTEKIEDGIRAFITVRENHRIENPVRICFGLMDFVGTQKIDMKVRIEDNAHIGVMASCSFPNAAEVLHTMDAEIDVGKNAEYVYLEQHVHSDQGGVSVVPKTKVRLAEGARFRTDFELIKGRVGAVDIDYEAECGPYSVLDMAARISGRGEDRIEIHEKADLVGEGSHGVLRTNIAVADNAKAMIKNTLIASAANSRGHVDCREVIRGNAIASAIPIVEVRHPKAHVTHEASIGSVDNKQLETLMSRGLSEDDATDLIIEGLLSPANR